MEECERWQSNRSPKCKGRPALRPDLVIVEGHQLVAVDAVADPGQHHPTWADERPYSRSRDLVEALRRAPFGCFGAIRIATTRRRSAAANRLAQSGQSHLRQSSMSCTRYRHRVLLDGHHRSAVPAPRADLRFFFPKYWQSFFWKGDGRHLRWLGTFQMRTLPLSLQICEELGRRTARAALELRDDRGTMASSRRPCGSFLFHNDHYF